MILVILVYPFQTQTIEVKSSQSFQDFQEVVSKGNIITNFELKLIKSNGTVEQGKEKKLPGIYCRTFAVCVSDVEE